MKCNRRPQKPGWVCVIEHGDDWYQPYPMGPCGLVPRWWNLRDRWRFRRMLK